jgi:hypothetical protein
MFTDQDFYPLVQAIRSYCERLVQSKQELVYARTLQAELAAKQDARYVDTLQQSIIAYCEELR